MTRILFRCDARPELGGGHVMRCLTLAEALARRGAQIAFATNREAETVSPALARSAYLRLDAHAPADLPRPAGWTHADWIVIDHYDLGAEEHRAMRRPGERLAVIDDLANRALDCDLLVDHNPGKRPADYDGLVPQTAERLVGPDFALLRPEFGAARAASLARRANPGLERILVTMGLTDVGAITARVVDGLARSGREFAIEAVIGRHAPSREALEARAACDARLTLTVDASDMATRMAEADLAIGAVGGTALERCVLGLPAIAVPLADNQRPATRALGEAGAVIVIEPDTDFEARLAASIEDLITQPGRLAAMSRSAAEICDGLGADRVADALMSAPRA